MLLNNKKPYIFFKLFIFQDILPHFNIFRLIRYLKKLSENFSKPFTYYFEFDSIDI